MTDQRQKILNKLETAFDPIVRKMLISELGELSLAELARSDSANLLERRISHMAMSMSQHTDLSRRQYERLSRRIDNMAVRMAKLEADQEEEDTNTEDKGYSTLDCLPCPTCGSEAVRYRITNYSSDSGYIACAICYKPGPEANSRQQAAQMWNALPRDDQDEEEKEEQDEEPELLPCPACGSAGQTDDAHQWFAFCSSNECRLYGPNGKDEDNAIQRWNALPRFTPEPRKMPHEDDVRDWLRQESGRMEDLFRLLRMFLHEEAADDDIVEYVDELVLRAVDHFVGVEGYTAFQTNVVGVESK